MADRPILFSAPMVLALLAGRKTQTRRILKIAPSKKSKSLQDWSIEGVRIGPLPYNAGDRLYVREAWRVTGNRDKVAPRDLTPRTLTTFFEAGGSMGGVDALPKDRQRSAAEYVPDAYYPPVGVRPEWVGRLRAGMHMPRWASRLTLTVTEVRVQRLQDITTADAVAEGADVSRRPGIDGGVMVSTENPGVYATPYRWYRDLWDHLNADRGFGWATNPWVVAVSFTVEHRNVDAVPA